MKKLQFLFVILIGILLIPNVVLADEVQTTSEENKKVNVYFFHGNGCPHCAEAEEFFKSIESEYGEMFNLVSYEVWYDEDNASLMEDVASARKEDVNGVPYIIIGDQSWQGYASSYNEEITSKIKSEYQTPADTRYDIMNYVDGIHPNTEEKSSYAGDIAVVIAIILVVAGVAGGVWYARKKAV